MKNFESTKNKLIHATCYRVEYRKLKQRNKIQGTSLIKLHKKWIYPNIIKHDKRNQFVRNNMYIDLCIRNNYFTK